MQFVFKEGCEARGRTATKELVVGYGEKYCTQRKNLWWTLGVQSGGEKEKDLTQIGVRSKVAPKFCGEISHREEFGRHFNFGRQLQPPSLDISFWVRPCLTWCLVKLIS